ncbi:copper homeostasis protein CutC [Orbus wheelerorum]|uniref:copper homeostasis protein CutC n=1 Tax=Orbus wheelerorum TaxID=3074111 RepID=UPI00370DE1E2
MKLEICCYSIDDIIVAAQSGADRIEFCAGRSDGGLTPSYGDLLQLSQLNLPIPIHPIIRPRGGDFYYSQSEINTMINDIKLVHDLNFAGVVFGALTLSATLDIENLTRLIEAAKGLSLTFHRAFDVCKNPLITLEQLHDLGFHRLLTSGQKNTALEGINLIEQLHNSSKNLIIMPGCGIKSANLQQFINIGISEFHSSATKTILSPMQHQNSDVSMSHTQNNESLRYTIDINEVQKMKYLIENTKSTYSINS